MEINVVRWNDSQCQQVSISFPELGQMLTISAADARTMAFMLMQCADFIDPPFEEEESFFGPYEDSKPDDNEEDDQLDN